MNSPPKLFKTFWAFLALYHHGYCHLVFLPQRYGGLGYRRSEDVKFAAFIGGFAMAAYGPYGIASYYPLPLSLTLIVLK